MKKVTIYKVNTYEAYRMDELGIYFSEYIPKDTIYYKHEILGSKEFSVPDWDDMEIVKEDNNTFHVVSVNGIKTFKWDE